jgi:taurine dioxygenase
MRLEALTESFGVAVEDVDLKTLSDGAAQTLYKRFVDAGVMCIRKQTLDPDAFLTFARKLGEPIEQIYGQFNIPERPEIGLLTSEDTDSSGSGQRKIRGTSWHTDASYFEAPPKATMLFAECVPASGGDTEFLSTAAAYAALPTRLKNRISKVQAVHNYQSSRSPRQLIARSAAQVEQYAEGTLHPLARRNPDNARHAIYLNPIRIEYIDGLARDESDALLDELLEFCQSPHFYYRHCWYAGDVVIWDNRSILHQANDDYDWRAEKRRLMRIMLAGERPV